MTDSTVTSGKHPWYKRHYHKLIRLDDSAHAIALGFSCGFFLGFTPLFGLKTLLSVLLAWILRCNKIAAVIGVTLHDFILPFVPVLLRIEYIVGYWLLSNPHRMPPQLNANDLRLEQLFHWTTFLTVGGPLMLGSIVVGTPFGLLSYYAARWVVQEFRQKRAAYRQHHPRRESDDTFS
ncbi:MAG TPA: DUF2062 domain-containing protein [Candidatus Paceibacterota bacterium]|nr:DUF2062 domain-containing protein [Candidatus Paceibacterota bacterium]